MADALISHRWFGNVLVPASGLALFLFGWLRCRPRMPWLTGAAMGIITCLVVLAGAFLYSLWIWNPPNHAWVAISPFAITMWLSALPIQYPANWVFGEDNLIEEHLLIPTAILSWALVGSAIGAIAGRFRR